MIRAIYCDEWGRVIGRAEETAEERVSTLDELLARGRAKRSLTPQVTFLEVHLARQGTQQRPAAHPFRFFKQVSP